MVVGQDKAFLVNNKAGTKAFLFEIPWPSLVPEELVKKILEWVIGV